MQGTTVSHGVIYLGSELFAAGHKYIALRQIGSKQALKSNNRTAVS